MADIQHAAPPFDTESARIRIELRKRIRNHQARKGTLQVTLNACTSRGQQPTSDNVQRLYAEMRTEQNEIDFYVGVLEYMEQVHG